MAIRGAFAACLLVLAGCPTVDLGDTPPDIGACAPAGGEAYFDAMIWPNYLSVKSPIDKTHTCLDRNCHGNGSFAGGMGFDTMNPTSANNYRIAQGEIECSVPTASRLLTKPLAGIEGHDGGDLFNSTDPEYQTFLNWFK